MWGILSGSPFRCPKSKWFNCSKTNQVDILFGEISVRWQKHVDNYPFSNLHRWVVVSHIHFVGVSATTGRLRAPTHLQPWNIRKVRRQHKYFLYFLMQMCWAFLSSKTTTASKKKQEKDLNTKGIGNSLLGSYCHHLHCQCSPNQSVILCFFLNLTFDCTCSEVSACPAALRHLSHSHLVPSEKAVSVSAKCKHRNISKQHYWIQHMNWKNQEGLTIACLWHWRSRHFCLFLLLPPNLGLSTQKSHVPQSFLQRQALHSPQDRRFRFLCHWETE